MDDHNRGKFYYSHLQKLQNLGFFFFGFGVFPLSEFLGYGSSKPRAFHGKRRSQYLQS